jgi:long-chain acyl-CoA synthetase
LEAAVVGVPDEIRGEEIKGFIVVKPGSNTCEDNFRSYCLERLAKYKCPKWFEIRGELPKGPTGKILKRALVRS